MCLGVCVCACAEAVDECKVIAMTAGTEAAEEERGSGQVRCSR